MSLLLDVMDKQLRFRSDELLRSSQFEPCVPRLVAAKSEAGQLYTLKDFLDSEGRREQNT